MNIKEKRLDREKFLKLVKFSLEKNERVVKQTENIFRNLTLKLFNDQTIHELNTFYWYLFHSIEKKMIYVIKKELYNDGYFIIDPFFKCNFKAIFPLIKYLFLDKNISTYLVKKNFNKIAMNERIKEIGGGYINYFLIIFRDEGIEYRKTLVSHGIPIKLKDIQTLKGIPKGVVCDILGAMRTWSKKRSKEF